MAARPRVSRSLIVLGAFCAYLGVLAGYTRSALFDSQSFGDRTVAAVRAEPVRAELATLFADQLIEQEPQLISARPVIISGAESVLASRASGGIIARAARDVHRGLLTADQPSVVVDFADLSVLVKAYLQAAGAKFDTAQIDPGRSKLLSTISDRTLGTQAAHVATRLSWIAFLGPVFALLAFAGAVATGGDRRRVLRDAGLALMGAGALVVTTKVAIGGVILAQIPPGGPTDIVLAVFDAYLGDLTTWALTLGAIGALLAAAAATLMGPLDAAALPRLVWDRVTHVPEQPWRRAARAAGLLVGGLLIVASPSSAVALAATIGGGYLALVGLTTLLAMLLGPPRDAQAAAPLRRRLVLGTAGAALALPVVAAVAIAAGTNPGDALKTTGQNDARCNGNVQLCGRRLDEVVFPTVHNAMSNAADNFLNANNGPNIESQLNSGIRGLLIDALAGQRNPDGVVRTDLTGTTEDIVVQQIGKEGLAAAQRLAGRVVFGPLTGTKRLYLCHVLCELGATDAITEFTQLHDWMERHPREVVIVFIQDEAPASMITPALRATGLSDLAVVLHPGQPLPTLGGMIRAGKRLVLLAENHAGAPWYPNGFEFFQDTPFRFEGPPALDRDSSCAENRGTRDNPMLLVNHWIETYPPNPRNAEIVNQKAAILARAERCMRVRGRVPNLFAVDFVERGDLVGAADTLNRELIAGTIAPGTTPKATTP